jgi:NAD(P)-dependent dehydrogenase (short-subunit alcohol dehydrogenase family)
MIRPQRCEFSPNPQLRQETKDMLLTGKIAVITGGAGLNGLGFATARLMALQGAQVVVLDLARADPAAAAAQLGTGHLGLVADVTDKASCDAAAAAGSARARSSTTTSFST